MALGGGAVAELARSYFDLRWHLDPVAASQAGVAAYDERLGRYSPDELGPHLAALKTLTGALEEAPVDDLPGEIDRTALLDDARVTLHRFTQDRPHTRNPEYWLTHLCGGLHVLLQRRPAGAPERERALVARLEDVPAFLHDARASLTEPVALFAQTALRMLPAAELLIREAAVAATGGHGARAAVAAEAALAALASFRGDVSGWTDVAEARFAAGEDAFNFHLHYEHALRDTAPELWRYGHHLVDEVEAELAARASRLDARRPWPDVVERLRADHPAADDLVAEYMRAMERARAFVEERGLAALPDAPLRVAATPAHLRPLVPYAAYDSPGPFSADRTGWFYVTVPEDGDGRERRLREHCRHALGATALHEGYPGHHLQLATAQALASDVRRVVWTPLTVEGWALYCEDMMGEAGFYATDEERVLQQVHLLLRAVRVLLDVGLHTRGMTVEQAVDTLVTRVHMERGIAEAEVRRYCATPTYPLCYAVGRRELLALRDSYRAARGGTSSPRAFHDAVLAYGGLPVSLMRWGLGLGE
jgi:uncharacterized protein (DUF885 family)